MPTVGADAGLPALTLHVHVAALAYAGTKAKGRLLPAPEAAAVPNTALAPPVDDVAATLTVAAHGGGGGAGHWSHHLVLNHKPTRAAIDVRLKAHHPEGCGEGGQRGQGAGRRKGAWGTIVTVTLCDCGCESLNTGME